MSLQRSKTFLIIRTAVVVSALVGTLAMPVVAGARSNDPDHDRLSTWFEVHRSHTNPHRADTDRDGLIDAQDDTDCDRLQNITEARIHTDPRRADTDRDGVSDAREDADHDGFTNNQEEQNGTDPNEDDGDNNDDNGDNDDVDDGSCHDKDDGQVGE